MSYLGQAIRSFGPFEVDARGQIFEGEIRQRGPGDPPYLPRLTDDSGNLLWRTLFQITYNLSPGERAGQTDFSAYELQRLLDSGHMLDLWPINGGPFHSGYNGVGVSPYGRLADDISQMSAERQSYWWQAKAFSDQLLTKYAMQGIEQPQPGVETPADVQDLLPQVAPGSLPYEGQTVSPEYTGPFQTVPSGGLTEVPTPFGPAYVPTPAVPPSSLAPTGGGPLVGVPDTTVIPSAGGIAILPPASGVVSPIAPSDIRPTAGGGAVPATAFPAWGYLLIGGLAIYLLAGKR